ncbi:hypothetical protein HMPREF1578_00988, partial [Gardnerella pickettii JCP8017B]
SASLAQKAYALIASCVLLRLANGGLVAWRLIASCWWQVVSRWSQASTSKSYKSCKSPKLPCKTLKQIS